MGKAIVYLAAGMSSRFGGEIKQFAKVGKNGETLMEVSMDQAIKAGFDKIIFIVGEKTEKLFKEKFGDSYEGVPVAYSYQDYDKSARDKPWGTADALCSAASEIDRPFVLCNGDDLYGEKAFNILGKHLDESDETASVWYPLSEVVPETGTVTRGTFEIKDSYVSRVLENFNIEKSKLAEKNLTERSMCSMTTFALQPEVVGMLQKKVEQFKMENEGDRRAESMITVHLNELIGEGKIKMKLYPSESKWIGITNPGDEVTVREFLSS